MLIFIYQLFMKKVTVGIDIGGTFTKMGIVDREGNCLMNDSIETQTNDNKVETFLINLHTKIEEMRAQFAGQIELVGIGIGAPNGNYFKGTIENAANLKWKGIVPFVDLFKNYYPGIPIKLTNDAKAAALGEMIYGAAKGMKNFIEITLGTGLGSGFVVNGDLVYGADGFAGELGHTLVKSKGRQCGCGKKGCLETYVSATGIKRTVYKMLADSLEPSELRGISFEDLDGVMITEAAKHGDKLALKVFDYTGKVLGTKLADAVAITRPEAIFLFGGLSLAGDFIFNPTKKYMEDALLPIYRKKIKVLPSGLKNNNAAILGSSALAWKELEK